MRLDYETHEIGEYLSGERTESFSKTYSDENDRQSGYS